MGIKGLAHNAIERIVARYGYELKMVEAPPCGYVEFLRRMVKVGIRPRTVFDIGVGHGTPWLYGAFPEAHFVLIEAQKDFEPELQQICHRIDAEYHVVAVGSTEQDRPIYRLPNRATGSSFLPPNSGTDQHYGASQKSEDKIHIVPLDTWSERPGPYFVKIDTEGFEFEILHGAAKVLEKTDVVLLETAITPRRIDEPDLIDVAAFMKSHGFCLIDFPVLTQQARHGPLKYVDAAFAKVCSPATRPLKT